MLRMDAKLRAVLRVHEVDLNIIERSRARKAEKLAVDEGTQKPSVAEGENKPLNQSEKSREQCHHSVVEVLP